MKKFFITLLTVCLLSAPAAARVPHHFTPKHHQPVKVIHHHHKGNPVTGLVLGLAGAAIGGYIYTAHNQTPVQYTNVTYVNEPPNPNCIVIISQSTGSVTKKCISTTQNEVIYID